MTTDISQAASALGKKGGKVTSQAKTEAARRNAKMGGRKPVTDDKRVYWAVFHSNGRNAYAYSGGNAKRDAMAHAKKIGGTARRFIGGDNVPERIAVR